MTSTAARIIVNADDLGMSQVVNDAIFALMAGRRVTSATIIANAPAVADAVRHTGAFGHCSFGVHLNLTQFRPLTSGAARLLTNEAGEMSRANESIRRTTPAVLQAAYDELCAQVDRVNSLGVRISHFDSHNHVHTRPQFFPVLKALQRRYGVRKVRIGKNLYSPEQPASRSMMWRKRAFNAALRSAYSTATTDAFTELMTYARLRELGQPRYGTTELMVHPGASYAGPETALLQSDWFDGESRECRWISYREL